MERREDEEKGRVKREWNERRGRESGGKRRIEGKY